MTGDAIQGTFLSDDVPNSKRYSFSFFAKLLSARVAMGFNIPKVFVNGTLPSYVSSEPRRSRDQK